MAYPSRVRSYYSLLPAVVAPGPLISPEIAGVAAARLPWRQSGRHADIGRGWLLHRTRQSSPATIATIESSRIGTMEIAGCQFSHDWEIVPGTWTIELWDDARKLASLSFQVVKELRREIFLVRTACLHPA